jgi:hypothetical protein
MAKPETEHLSNDRRPDMNGNVMVKAPSNRDGRSRENEDELEDGRGSGGGGKTAVTTSWNIKRVRRHNVDRVLDNDDSSRTSKTASKGDTAVCVNGRRRRLRGSDGGSAKDSGQDETTSTDDDGLDEGEEETSYNEDEESEMTHSMESLDSIVERILEHAADGKRKQQQLTDLENNRTAGDGGRRRPHSAVETSTSKSQQWILETSAYVDRLDTADARPSEQSATNVDQGRITWQDSAKVVDVSAAKISDEVSAVKFATSCSSSRPTASTRTQSQPSASASSGTAEGNADQMRPKRFEETSLEELFEAAVEALASNNEKQQPEMSSRQLTTNGNVDGIQLTAAGGHAVPPQHLLTATTSPPPRRFRGEENWQREVYDDELHEHCHQYRLTSFTHRDFTQIRRGFAMVEKIDKKPAATVTAAEVIAAQPPQVFGCVSAESETAVPADDGDADRKRRDVVPYAAETETMETKSTAGVGVYHQRTVISATVSTPSESRRNYASGGDRTTAMAEGGCSEQPPALISAETTKLTRSSSSGGNWDSVSVDSLVVYDDESSTVRGIYSCNTQTTLRGDGEAADTAATGAGGGAAARAGDDDQCRAASAAAEVAFVDSIRRLKRDWRRPPAERKQTEDVGGGDQEIGAIWVQRSGPEDVVEDSGGDQQQSTEPVSNVDGSDVSPLDDGFKSVDRIVVADSVVAVHPEVTSSTDAAAATDSNNSSMVSKAKGDGDAFRILSDAVTTQEIVITVRLPPEMRRRMRLRKSASAIGPRPPIPPKPTIKIPFRELTLHREIRLLDDDDDSSLCPSSRRDRFVTNSAVSSAEPARITSSTTESDGNGTRVTSPVDATGNEMSASSPTRREAAVTTSSSDVIRLGDLTAMSPTIVIPGCEVEYENSWTSRTTDRIPPLGGGGTDDVTEFRRVDVCQTNSVRVLHVPPRSAAPARPELVTASLQELVDGVRTAMLADGRLKAAGVGVTCEAVETVTCQSDESVSVVAPPVVRTIAVDCLPANPAPAAAGQF